MDNCNNKYRLGINTGFALNRFPTPEQWMKLISEELGLKYIQLTADLINPPLDDDLLYYYIEKINILKKNYGIIIDSLMTGAFTRVNHFAHPDTKIREFWFRWFKKFIDIAVSLGATNVSSHLGIMSYDDINTEDKRLYRLGQTINYWIMLASYAKKKGLSYLSWEPMSIKREFGETIKEANIIQDKLKNSEIPIYICLDVDHGDVSSNNPDDYNPYKWIENFASKSPLIHLKQSIEDKGGHYPFTSYYNHKGKITPEKVITSLNNSNAMKNTLLLLELSFREREPMDSNVISDLKESAKYWKKYLGG